MNKKIKLIAFYLPQFHAIPENDKWWGKGFTEWTHVKKAKPLFKGHNQPKIPLNKNYYNLLNPKVRYWQQKLAKKYGIFGFCYYHYWFNGKLLIEKPAEMILEDPKLDMPFCFSWANESWTRTWDGQDKEILMEQKYGKEKDWKKHFNYLLKFFKLNVYIRINKKPLLLIYRATNIPNFDKMINYWSSLAKEANLEGIYVAETVNGHQSKKFSRLSQAIVEFEPGFTLAHDVSLYFRAKRYTKHLIKQFINPKYLIKISYDYIWKRILTRKRDPSFRIFLGAFIDWDNTARKKYNSHIFINVALHKFEQYLAKHISLAKKIKSDFIFINAWNEWSEGAYLEPDEKNKFTYLETINRILKLK